jgi:hypothetical protein
VPIDLDGDDYHTSPAMNFDISHLLEHWDYQPGQIVVRRFKGKDGLEKIQLRVDLGLLQMNAEGRPDGKRPLGHESVFEFQQERLQKHVEASGGEDGFILKADDCAKLQLEALQYHHRYICLLELQDHPAVIRDTDRNLAVFDFVGRFAETEELAWSLQQFRPQLLLIQTRAQGGEKLASRRFAEALRAIDSGMAAIRQFYNDSGRAEAADHSAELAYLETWRMEINDKRPLSRREKLENALHEAVRQENYEKAAEVRDALRKLDGK